MKNQNIIKKHFDLLEKSLSWILSGVNHKGMALGMFTPLLSHLKTVFKTRGLVAGIAHTKAVRTGLMNYLSGNPLRPEGVRCTTRGIPICLGPCIKVLEGQPSQLMLRMLTTILFSTRALKTKANPDIENIVAPSKRGASHHIGLFAGDFWRQLGYIHKGDLPRSLKFRRFHFTTKSGPNGHALSSCYQDLFILPEGLIKSIKIMGGSKIVEAIETAIGSRDIISGFWSTVGKSFRKITYFADKEDKTRVIAICDYWSQTVLKPLHSYLFRVLKKIPQDMTFNQGEFINHCKDWEVFYSIDLKAATDRFPIDLIHNVLAAHLPISYVDSWKDVMVGYPFDFEGRKISYSVGNPMGAYSSWSSFTIAHHYLIYYICRLEGIDWSKLNYALLGDDLVIGNKAVGEAYLRIIKSLGVDVSELKTHKSTTTLEFAKRWIHKGQEITPFPISALKNSGKRYYLLLNLLLQETKKGWDFTVGIAPMVGSYYGRVFNRPSRFRKRMEVQAYLLEQLMKVIWGDQPAADGINAISRKLEIPLPLMMEEVALGILSNVMVELFAESNPENQSKTGGKPLGLLAETLVMYLTGHDDPRAFSLLENPLLHACGSVEQSYLDLKKEARRIDTVGGGNWPIFLRNMTIPLSDQIFVDRQSDTETRAVAAVVTKVAERLHLLSQTPPAVLHMWNPRGWLHN